MKHKTKPVIVQPTAKPYTGGDPIFLEAAKAIGNENPTRRDYAKYLSEAGPIYAARIRLKNARAWKRKAIAAEKRSVVVLPGF